MENTIMKKRTMSVSVIMICIYCLCGIGSSYAGKTAEIILMDGTVVQGEVVSKTEEGAYTIRSPSLGRVAIHPSQIKSISFVSSSDCSITQRSEERSPLISSSNNQLNQQIQHYTQKIQSSPEALNGIQAMANNERIQAVVSDPELKRAIETFDFETLQNSPKFRELMESQEMKELTETVLRQ